MTFVFASSSGMYTLAQGTLSTVDLKNLLTALIEVLMNGKADKAVLIIISRTM